MDPSLTLKESFHFPLNTRWFQIISFMKAIPQDGPLKSRKFSRSLITNTFLFWEYL